jgi:hypothetical protein
MKKFIALFLVFSILTLSGNLFAKKRKGADLFIQKKDGTQVKGELIAVKQNSLLLIERNSGADETVNIRKISIIRIVKKSKTLAGCITGLFLGAAVGYAIGYPQGDEGGFVIISKPLAGGIGAAIGGASCALIGIGIGAAVGADKTIQLIGKSDSEIQEILEELRKKARIRSIQ